jgi:hypothetical protein
MTRATALAALLAAAALAPGCIPEEGPMMEPGSNCLECHSGGEAPRWTLAGTLTGRGIAIPIRDANGKSFTLHSNQAGNFWTAESLAFPVRVTAEGMNFNVTAADAECNRCHAAFLGGGGGD